MLSWEEPRTHLLQCTFEVFIFHSRRQVGTVRAVDRSAESCCRSHMITTYRQSNLYCRNGSTHPAFVVFCGRSNPGESTLRLSQILDDSNALGTGGKHIVISKNTIWKPCERRFLWGIWSYPQTIRISFVMVTRPPSLWQYFGRNVQLRAYLWERGQ